MFLCGTLLSGLPLVLCSFQSMDKTLHLHTSAVRSLQHETRDRVHSAKSFTQRHSFHSIAGILPTINFMTAHTIYYNGRVATVTAAHGVCERPSADNPATWRCPNDYRICTLGDVVYDLAVWTGCAKHVPTELGGSMHALDLTNHSSVVMDPVEGAHGVIFGDGTRFHVATTHCSHAVKRPFTIADGWSVHIGEWVLASPAHHGFSGGAIM